MKSTTFNIFTDIIKYSGSSIIIKSVSILLVPIYTRIFQPEMYGVIDFYNSIKAFLIIFISLDLTQSIARYYYDYKDGELNNFLFTNLMFIVVSNALFLFVIQFFYSNINIGLFDGYLNRQTYVLMSLIISISMLNNFCLMIVRFELKPNIYIASQAISSLLQIALTFLFVVVLRYEIFGVILSIFISAITNLVILYSNSFRKVSGGKFRKHYLVQSLKFSVPLVPSSLSILALLNTDRISIRNMLSLKDLGVYAMALKLSLPISLLSNAIRMTYLPFFYKNRDDRNWIHINKFVNFVFLFFVLIAIFSISLFAQEFLKILTTAPYYGAYVYVPFIASSYLLGVLINFRPELYLNNKTVYVSILNFGGAILNVVLNIVLIRKFGSLGAAIATASTTIISTIIYYGLTLKYNSRNKIVEISILALSVVPFVIHYTYMQKYSVVLKASILAIQLVVSVALILKRYRQNKDVLSISKQDE